MFKFAIWGCGLISDIHADAIGKIKGASLSGAFDVNSASLNRFCQKHQAHAFSSPEELINSEKTDAVCICLPSGLHYSAAMHCIQNKKHVIIEKPMALTPSQAEDIICAAKENNVSVCVISQLRYSPAAKKVKEIIKNGKLGTVTLGNAIMKYWRSPDYYANSSWRGTWEMDGGGALMNQGIHGIDLLQYFMGKVVSVFACAKTLVHDIETEDTLTAVLEYENGAIGTVQATTSVYPGYERRIEICGSKGSVVLCEDKIEICDVEEETVSPCKKSTHRTANTPENLDSALHKAQIEAFMQDALSGRQPKVNAIEGKKSIDIICAIYESAQTGKKIYL